MTNDITTLDGFFAEYADGTDRVVYDVDMNHEREHSPFIIVRFHNKTVILNPMAFAGASAAADDDPQSKESLCIDAHTFVDGQRARAGVFGMDDGRRVSFDKDEVAGTSFGWPAASLVALLVGEQG